MNTRTDTVSRTCQSTFLTRHTPFIKNPRFITSFQFTALIEINAKIFTRFVFFTSFKMLKLQFNFKSLLHMYIDGFPTY